MVGALGFRVRPVRLGPGGTPVNKYRRLPEFRGHLTDCVRSARIPSSRAIGGRP
jgi:hypothetical protein